MNMHRNKIFHSKYLLSIFTLSTILLLTACGKSNTSGTQARTDLTTEHVRGLYSGMMRKDIEDLLGSSDTSLAAKETIEVYSLADGSTAILRYHDDTLKGAYIRDKENKETPLFGYNDGNIMNNDGLSPVPNGIQEVLPESVPETSVTDETSLLETETITETMMP